MGTIKDVGVSYAMIEEYNIDPITWYSERELNYTPKHFTIANTHLTDQSKNWILNNLRGRFSIVHKTEDEGMLSVLSFSGNPAFEDPKEAMLYELTWS